MALGKASVSRRDAGTRDEGPEKTSGAEAGAAGGRGRGGRCLVGVRGEPPGDRDGEKAVFRRRRQAAGRVSEVSSAAGPRPPTVGGFRLPFGLDRVCPPAPALRRLRTVSFPEPPPQPVGVDGSSGEESSREGVLPGIGSRPGVGLLVLALGILAFVVACALAVFLVFRR